jgi:hypothetical protein
VLLISYHRQFAPRALHFSACPSGRLIIYLPYDSEAVQACETLAIVLAVSLQPRSAAHQEITADLPLGHCTFGRLLDGSSSPLADLPYSS